MSNYEQVDYFTDPSLIEDPYSYFEYLRGQGPICRMPRPNVMAVTGYDEAVAIINDANTFSSAVAVTGPIPDLPFTPEGDDITEQLEAHRHELPASVQIVAKDGTEHANNRALLMRLFTPTRLRENEEFMWSLADKLIDEFIDDGQCNLIKDFGTPYATLVIADLLGVPDDDRDTFRAKIGIPPGAVDGSSYEDDQAQSLGFLYEYFYGYLAERRESPRDDILGEFAQAKFPDGSTPTIDDLVWLSTFLFGAGQDTTARLLGASLKILCQQPEIQEQLRADRSLMAGFIEEVLRIDGPVKMASRLTLKSTSVSGVDIPAGTVMCMFYGACNRDPRAFDYPTEFRMDRPNPRKHLAFGRGKHACAGMPLAKAEATAGLNRILDRMADIRLSEKHHGKPGDQHFEYVPIYILRALENLYLEFTPVK